MWDIDEKNNNQTKLEIESDGGRAFAYKCDLSSREDIYRVAKEVKFKASLNSMHLLALFFNSGKKRCWRCYDVG